MKFSIVIPVYNKVHYTRQCLKTLCRDKNNDTEIIVIDNASSDESTKLKDEFNEITYIRNEDNRGCAGAWNQGVKQSIGDWVVILNNDVELTDKWLDHLRLFASAHSIDIVSPGIREGDFDYKLQPYADQYTSTMQNVIRRGSVYGICFMVKKEVFKSIGLFDENFKIGQYEDADFFRRCKFAGIKSATTGSVLIHHYGSVTQKSLQKPDMPDYAKKNQIYYRKKWKLGWGKRHLERYIDQLTHWYWRKTEFYKHKHTLFEKSENGKLTYL